MDVSLHPRQEEIFTDDHRFKVVAAGRRFGKSFLAAVTLLVEAAKTEHVRTDGVRVDLSLEEVFYVGPIFQTTKENLWPVLLELGEGLIAQKWENTGILELVNGRRIKIKGTDRADNIRGMGLSYVVLDEYAFMGEDVWEYIIEPMLLRSEGGALFIGTPAGKNHFHELWLRGMSDDPRWSEWKAWTFHSKDNPHLMSEYIERKRETMSDAAYRQELEASFETGAGLYMTPQMFKIKEKRPYPGDVYIAIDLAGFSKSEGGRKIKRLDEHAIAIVLNHKDGWHIIDIIHGQWDTRETALRIVKAYRDYRPVKIGIEKGMAKNAVMPYLQDEMARLGTFFNVDDLTHGNQKKEDRILWSLQGRAEKGRISLEPGAWNKDFLAQVADFPSTISHDDLIDAVSYIDQLADPWFDGPDLVDDWQPLDVISGY